MGLVEARGDGGVEERHPGLDVVFAPRAREGGTKRRRHGAIELFGRRPRRRRRGGIEGRPALALGEDEDAIGMRLDQRRGRGHHARSLGREGLRDRHARRVSELGMAGDGPQGRLANADMWTARKLGPCDATRMDQRSAIEGREARALARFAAAEIAAAEDFRVPCPARELLGGSASERRRAANDRRVRVAVGSEPREARERPERRLAARDRVVPDGVERGHQHVEAIARGSRQRMRPDGGCATSAERGDRVGEHGLPGLLQAPQRARGLDPLGNAEVARTRGTRARSSRTSPASRCVTARPGTRTAKRSAPGRPRPSRAIAPSRAPIASGGASSPRPNA